jgi:hypothetical protein
MQVWRWPPGIKRLLLSATHPIERIVRASLRPLPPDGETPSTPWRPWRQASLRGLLESDEIHWVLTQINDKAARIGSAPFREGRDRLDAIPRDTWRKA